MSYCILHHYIAKNVPHNIYILGVCGGWEGGRCRTQALNCVDILLQLCHKRVLKIELQFA